MRINFVRKQTHPTLDPHDFVHWRSLVILFSLNKNKLLYIIREKMTLHKEPMNLFSVVMNIIDRIGHVNP